MGIYPSSFLDFMHVSVSDLVSNYQSALVAAGKLPAEALALAQR
jgi:hypothetical protein